MGAEASDGGEVERKWASKRYGKEVERAHTGAEEVLMWMAKKIGMEVSEVRRMRIMDFVLRFEKIR